MTRALAGALLAAAILAQGGAAVAQPLAAPVKPVAVIVDGKKLGAIALAQHGGETIVALEPLAAAVGWHVQLLTEGARLTGDDRTVVLAVGARFVRENNETRRLFDHPLIERGTRLYLAASDAARLFGLEPPRAGAALAFTHPVAIGRDTRIAEIPRPATPAPVATPRPATERANAQLAAAAGAGRVSFSIEQIGHMRMLQFTGETRGEYMHTLVSAYGVDQFSTPDVTLSLGSPQRHVDAGMLTDPLAGLIFGGGIYEGVDVHRGDQHLDAFAGHRLDNGNSFVGATVGDPYAGGSESLELVSHGGAYEDALLRRYAIWRRPWGDFRTEMLMSDRGAGIGFGARTRGRTFVETAVTAVHGSLPLGPNDAPVRIDVGRELSDATTLLGGFTSGPQQPMSPFAAISSRMHGFVTSLSVTDRTMTASLSYQSAAGSLQFFSIPGVQHDSGVNGTLYVPGGTIQLAASLAAGSTGTSLTFRTARRGINLIAGVGGSSGHAGPIAGVSIPVSSRFALDTTVRPSGGSTAVRIGLSMALPSRRAVHVATFPAAIRIAGTSPAPLRLFIDGVPGRTLASADDRVEVARGEHVFSVESIDGAFGSPDVAKTVDGPDAVVTLPVWPQREILGRVVLADPRSVGADFSLAGIVVTIGDVTTETTAEGTFVFAKQPLDPEAKIAIDQTSLPRELRAPEPRALGDGDIVLTLRPGLRIERQVFPSSH